MNIAVPRLVAGLTRGLFTGDLERHWQSLLDYEVKVVELDWSRVKTE
jgi:FAD-dependent urate hydroxylase